MDKKIKNTGSMIGVGPMFTSDPGEQVASRIYIITNPVPIPLPDE